MPDVEMAPKRPQGIAHAARVHLLRLLVVAVGIACVESGRIKIPLPGPGGRHVHPTNLALPYLGKPAPLPSHGPLAANTLLRDTAVRLFDGRIHGAESVAVRKDGVLVMLDKYGQMWEAHPAAQGKDDSKSTGNATTADAPPPAYVLDAAPVASLQASGGGRPLGFTPDEATGDVYVCDSRRGLVVVEGKAGRRVRDVATAISLRSRARGGERIPYANDLDLMRRRRTETDGGATATTTTSTSTAGKKAKEDEGAATAGKKEEDDEDLVVYFTSCTDIDPPFNAKEGFYDTMRGYQLDLAQGAPRGALLAWSPSLGGGGAVLVAEGFYYANGVALSAGGDYALVVETNRNRVLRVWLDGRPGGDGDGGAGGQGNATAPVFRLAENSGPGGPGATLAEGFRVAPRVEVFADGLPGIPDGVNAARPSRYFGGEGGGGEAFWVALIGPVPPVARLIGLAGVRAAYAWLPESLRPGVKPWGAALRLRASDGGSQALLLDPTGERVSSVSAVTESADGRVLFLGNLVGDYVSMVSLEAAGEWLRRRR